jgi:hypothetical protein
MNAIADLAILLKELRPALQPGVYAFCSWNQSSPPDVPVVAMFREAEGLTLIVDEAEAHALGLPCAFRAAWITLQVNSDLLAVGLLAEVTRVLASAGIACNVYSAVNHDHLFVPVDRATEAMSVLEQLSASG